MVECVPKMGTENQSFRWESKLTVHFVLQDLKYNKTTSVCQQIHAILNARNLICSVLCTQEVHFLKRKYTLNYNL